MRRTCFTIERQSLILQEPSSTIGDIPRKIAVLPYAGRDLKIYQKRSRTNKKVRTHQVQMIWIHVSLQMKLQKFWSNGDSSWQAVQCNQVSARVLFAISRCDHLQNKPMAGEDANVGPSETSLFKGHQMAGRTWFLGWIRQHSSCSIGGSVDLLALGRWYLLILETFDICPIPKLKWIYTDQL